MVDSGRDWVWAAELARGKLLYRDLFYHHGPLPPYLNASLFALFGARLDVLLWAGILLAALAVAFLYRLSEPLVGGWWAAAAGVAFVYECAFSQLSSYGCYNWVLPYSWAATYGTAATLGSTLALLSWREEGSRTAATGALLGLAVATLCKLELGAAALGVHALYWALERPRRVPWGAYAACLAAVAGVYAGFGAAAGWAQLANRNLLIRHNFLGASQWHAAGWDHPWSAGALVALSAAASLGVAWAADRAADQRWWAAAAVAALGAWLGPDLFWRGLPLILAFAFFEQWRRPRSEERSRALLVMALALFSLPRNALNCGAYHYGFFLLAPGLAAYPFALLRVLPRRLGRPSESGRSEACVPLGELRPAGAAIVAAFLAGGLGAHLARRQAFLSARGVAVQLPRGSLFVEARYAGLAEAGRFLSGYAGRSALAVPEGSGLLFLAGLRHPFPLDTLLPRDLPDDAAQDRALAWLEASPPDFVLAAPRDTSEFGHGAFGYGYGRRVAEWFNARYRVAGRWGAGGAEAFLLRRREAQ